MDFERVDMDNLSEEELQEAFKMNEILFRLNHTMPMTPEYGEVLKELFGDNIGENSMVQAPGITIEDDVMLAANVQLLSNNHDEYDRQVLLCKPIHIKKGAWIGAGASILPGVTIGEYAIVGAGAIVTKDVGDYEVAVGVPAKVVKKLDQKKFEK